LARRVRRVRPVPLALQVRLVQRARLEPQVPPALAGFPRL
jgi:hypothetical protein